MLSKLDSLTKYCLFSLLLNLASCKPSRNFWDVIGDEIGEPVNGNPDEIEKYEEKLCHIENIQCYDCKEFQGDEETCRGFSYCWFNCHTKECLHSDDVVPNKYCSTYCQECPCLGDDRCTWDPVDGICVSANCPSGSDDHFTPFDIKKHCHNFEVDTEESDFVFGGKTCEYSSWQITNCDPVRKWEIDDETPINIGSDGQFQIRLVVWNGGDQPEEIQIYLSFNGLQLPVKTNTGVAFYLHFTVQNGQPSITGFANRKPLKPLQDNRHLSLSISSSGNCELGQITSSSIIVFQLPEHWKCSGYRGNQCRCQQPFSGCSYMHSTRDCVPLEIDLKNGWFLYRFECASIMPQAHSYIVKRYFIEDGGYRKSYGSSNGPDCKIQETIIAVNIMGKKFTDTNGIVLEAGSDVVPDASTDAAEFEAGDSTTSSCQFVTIEEGRDVYGTLVQGRIDSKDDLGKCLSYSFAVTKDGLYTLNVKFFDIDSGVNFVKYLDRIFDIKLNNVVVAGGINLAQLLEYSGCYGVDINIYFEVSNGLKTVKMTSDSRIPDWEISNGEMTVGFCNSPCEGNSAFMVSAFSVARYTSRPEYEF